MSKNNDSCGLLIPARAFVILIHVIGVFRETTGEMFAERPSYIFR